ncbi:MAG: ATP-grasp domain-containing protein, partial [Actinobacteria bacterium]
MDRADLEARLNGIYGRHRWIIALDVAAAATGVVATLRRLGAADLMVIAATEGVGDLPDAPVLYTRSRGDTVMGGIRAFLSSIEDAAPRLVSAVEEFDPDGRARVITVPFGSVQAVAGRPVYGARRPAWGALEDKTTVGDLWSAAGIATAPQVLTTPQEAARVDLGGPLGTVWVADNREGWHGAGDYVRWVRTPADAAAAVEWFTTHAHRVRVMPFLDGIPCSTHGIVTGDGIAVLRPLEMIVLRLADGSGFFYAGACNFWDPDEEAREEMRSVARSVGEALRDRVGYLGPYGIDGVLTEDGFLPTELNPRLSAGHALPARAADLPLGLMSRALVDGGLD